MWSIDLAKGGLKHFWEVGFQEWGFVNKKSLVPKRKDDLLAPILETIASGFGAVKDKSSEAAMREEMREALSQQTVDANQKNKYTGFSR